MTLYEGGMTEPITLATLDDLLDELPDAYQEGMYDHLVGHAVDWHGSLVGTLVTTKDGCIAIQVTLHCARCDVGETTAYLTSGLHRGAWCYVVDEEGHYQANLRDQEYVCDACSGEGEE